MREHRFMQAHPMRELTPDQMIREGAGSANLWTLAMIVCILGALLALAVLIPAGPTP